MVDPAEVMVSPDCRIADVADPLVEAAPAAVLTLALDGANATSTQKFAEYSLASGKYPP